MTDVAYGLGHNQPPEADESEAALFQRADALVKNANRWAAERPAITDREMAGACSRFIEQLRDIKGALDAKLKDLRKPFNDGLAELRERYRDPLALIDLALNMQVELSTAWLQKQKDVIAAERRTKEQEANDAIAEAARLQHEAQQPGATMETRLAYKRAEERAAKLTDHALSMPDRPQIRDDQTRKAMSLKKRWKARIDDWDKALAHYIAQPEMREHIEARANYEARFLKDASKAPPGVTFYVEERAV